MSEDCLYLNVFRPAQAASGLLPVMVSAVPPGKSAARWVGQVEDGGAHRPWAHRLVVQVWFFGGSWEYGGSSFVLYDGHGIVTKGQVVLVVPNYRLGPFGFLASAQLANESTDGSTGNYGIQVPSSPANLFLTMLTVAQCADPSPLPPPPAPSGSTHGPAGVSRSPLGPPCAGE
jgi:hypothetical protein